MGEELVLKGSKLIEENPTLAIRWIKAGMAICPQESRGWFNLGIALHKNKMIREAIKAYKIAIDLPNAPYAAITNNLAQDLLLNGEFEEGWRLYEQRTQTTGNTYKIFNDKYGISWKGFKDKRKCGHLIVVAEQGLGDTLQFCRLVLTLSQYGIETTLFCQEPLAKLLRNGSQIKNIETSLVDNYGKHTRWCPLMSLAGILGINENNIPYKEGYILPNSDHVKKWEKELGRQMDKMLIALHWQGNPNFERRMYSKGRSIPVEQWNALRAIKNCEFVSIQKGEAKKERQLLNQLNFVKGQEKFDKTLDFEDTAGILANCDMLISADSSVVHLAGSMNIPTYVALTWVPEWRWGIDTDTSRWYKSIKLFRQQRKEAWGSVVENIIKALSGKI